MKGVIHKFNLEIYKTDLRFCFHKETMEKACGDNLYGYAGYTWWPHRSDVVWIFLEKYNGGINVPNAAHECYHAADFICQRTGMMQSNENSNEHIAYLVGYLMTKIFDALDNDNKMESKR